MSTPKTPPSATPISTTPNGGYTETLVSPVAGSPRITSGFGTRSAPKTSTGRGSSNHKGIDIAVPQGTPVMAAASGTVTYSGTKGGYGNFIEITHGDGTKTDYAHLSQIGASKGTVVSQGEVIGKSGGAPGTAGAGNSSGSHLHYEVKNKAGVAINPLSRTTVNSNNNEAPGQKLQDTIEKKERLAVLNYKQDEIIDALISGKHFTENAANEFENLTYHWRLFMTTDQEIVSRETTQANSTLQSFYEKLAAFTQVTIAESGVTGFVIDEVTMDATVGTDFQTESTLFTSIEMKITEPNGVNFLDSLRNAGLKTGVRNYQKTFYYLELSFKGYREDGTIDMEPFKDSPNGGHWLWTVAINNIDVALSAGGGTYNLTMVPLTDTLLTGTYNLVPASVHVNGGTVGEFMDNLCLRLNNVWEKIKGGAGIVTYKAQFHPIDEVMTADQARAIPVTPADVEINSERDIAFDADRTAHIAQGFTISRVLDSLMRSCEEAQKLAKDSVNQNGPNDSANGPNAKMYRQSIIWRIEPEVNLPNYDPIFNEYYHQITLHIYGFRHHTAVLSPQDTISDKEAQVAILADMAKKNFLPKKYEYLFTGVNSEVIDIDLNFNLKWQALLPRLADASEEQVAPHAKANPTPSEAAKIERENNSPQRIGSDLATSAQDRISAEKEYTDALKAQPQDQELITKLKAKLDAAVAANKAAIARAQQKRSELQAARPATAAKTIYERIYGETLTAQKTELTAIERTEAFPITIQTYNPEDASGLAGQYHSGKSLYGAVLNQVYGPLATQFFKISMTVRGDPFWIGAGSFEQAILRKSDVFDGKHPNYSQGANAILFKMKYPLGQDNNGDVILNTNETVTGIYQINKIQHKFVDGKFTQVMQCTRVPIIDLYTSLYDTKYGGETDPKAGA